MQYALLTATGNSKRLQSSGIKIGFCRLLHRGPDACPCPRLFQLEIQSPSLPASLDKHSLLTSSFCTQARIQGLCCSLRRRSCGSASWVLEVPREQASHQVCAGIVDLQRDGLGHAIPGCVSRSRMFWPGLAWPHMWPVLAWTGDPKEKKHFSLSFVLSSSLSHIGKRGPRRGLAHGHELGHSLLHLGHRCLPSWLAPTQNASLHCRAAAQLRWVSVWFGEGGLSPLNRARPAEKHAFVMWVGQADPSELQHSRNVMICELLHASKSIFLHQ